MRARDQEHHAHEGPHGGHAHHMLAPGHVELPPGATFDPNPQMPQMPAPTQDDKRAQ
jgi:hypothetical protein